MVRERELQTLLEVSLKYFWILINTHKTVIIFVPIYFEEMNVKHRFLCPLV
jgi:hypothetical protein